RLPVRLVVLAGIGNDIGEGETVVRGDEVDGAGALSGEDLRGARHRRGEGTAGVAAALPEPADGDPVAVVPFEEGRGETAEVVAAGADVPGFGDQDAVAQHRIGDYLGQQ